VTVRVYSPAQDIVLPDNTIVFIIGTLHAPVGQAAFIDCKQKFSPFPRDPPLKRYQDRMFDMPNPHIYAISQASITPIFSPTVSQGLSTLLLVNGFWMASSIVH